MLNREHCRTTSSAAPPESMHEAHRPSAMHHQTTTTPSDHHLATSPDEQQQQAHYSAHFPSMQSPIHTGHPYMSHLHHMDNNNNNNSSNTSISNTQTSNLLLLTDFEPTTNASPLGSAIRHNSQAYRYMHSAHPPPMQSYHPAISLGGVGATAAAATAYYAFNGEPLDPLLIHPSMPIIPTMQQQQPLQQMPSSSSLSRSRQIPQKSFSTPLSLYQFEQFLAQPSVSAAAPSPPASSSSAATTYCIPIAPLNSLDFPDPLPESANPPTPTNLNEKNLGVAAVESSAAFVVVSTPTSFIENNAAASTTTTAFIQQPHSLSNSPLESSPIIVCVPKKCSAKRSRITQTALLYLIDRYNENSSPSTAQLQVYAQHLNMDVPKVRIWCVFLLFFWCLWDVQP
ncbi:hypothetical protein CcCBS67573_g07997 [Chytriomyces confervae]|uniref:Homeobox domain-containing protein n=1 Tax=Chytriomyces confervae TaxID=246404 RepID=A0A507EPX5_9FUNG|nr:hypothetical protein CcCBS67573_g07997 [Chytriomyces confervae]